MPPYVAVTYEGSDTGTLFEIGADEWTLVAPERAVSILLDAHVCTAVGSVDMAPYEVVDAIQDDVAAWFWPEQDPDSVVDEHLVSSTKTRVRVRLPDSITLMDSLISRFSVEHFRAVRPGHVLEVHFTHSPLGDG